MRNLSILIIAILFVTTACNKENVKSTNEVIFDQMWNDFNETYAVFEPRNVDWDQVYQTFKPELATVNTEAELWDLMCRTLDVLYDAHVNLMRPDGPNFESGSYYADPDEQFEYIQETAETYLEDIEAKVESNNMYYTKVKDENIGYISIRDFGNRDLAWEENIDVYVDQLRNTDAIIIDIRNNSGGSDFIGERIARMFAKERKHAYNKKTINGPGKDDFDEIKSFYLEPSPNAYVKPVIVLINFYSVSAAEVFSMYMETQDHVQFLGRHTSQAFSDVSFERFLPNGWSYSMSHQLYSYPNGISPEGTGILPDIPLINDYNEVQAGIDRQLELAISILR